MLKNTINHSQKNTKLVKQSKIITQQPKTFENPNIFYITSVKIEHSKTSHKLSNIVRQAEKLVKVFSTKKCKKNKMMTCF